MVYSQITFNKTDRIPLSSAVSCITGHSNEVDRELIFLWGCFDDRSTLLTYNLTSTHWTKLNGDLIGWGREGSNAQPYVTLDSITYFRPFASPYNLFSFNLTNWETNRDVVIESALPEDVYDQCITGHGKEVYLLGCNFGGTVYDYFRIFNISSSSWTSGTSLPVPTKLSGCGYSEITDTLYLFGGYGNEYAIDKLGMAPVMDDEWTILSATMTNEYYAHVLQVFQEDAGVEYLYVVGGTPNVFNVDKLNPLDDSIEYLGDILLFNHQHSMTVTTYEDPNGVDFKLFVMGGAGGNRTERSSIISITPSPTTSPTTATEAPSNYPAVPTTTSPSKSPTPFPSGMYIFSFFPSLHLLPFVCTYI